MLLTRYSGYSRMGGNGAGIDPRADGVDCNTSNRSTPLRIMFVVYDTEKPPGRHHPWTVAVKNPEEQYVDFRAHPDQIPLVLPDFKPWSHYSAIQTFYALLTWLNGPDSIFESNDCALGTPRRDNDTPEIVRRAFEADPIVIYGRLTIIFRDLSRNASVPAVEELKRSIHDGLRDNVRNIPAVVKIGDWDHLFTAINQEGRAITLLYWAWGDDEAMAMAHLNTTFDAIYARLRWISNGTKSRA
jgi:hypothetical protein